MTVLLCPSEVDACYRLSSFRTEQLLFFSPSGQNGGAPLPGASHDFFFRSTNVLLVKARSSPFPKGVWRPLQNELPPWGPALPDEQNDFSLLSSGHCFASRRNVPPLLLPIDYGVAFPPGGRRLSGRVSACGHPPEIRFFFHVVPLMSCVPGPPDVSGRRSLSEHAPFFSSAFFFFFRGVGCSLPSPFF